MTYIRPTSDMFIKYLFGREQYSDLLVNFINATQKNCDLPLFKSVEVKNPFNLKTFSTDKDSILDIKAVAQTGEIVHIEVQNQGNTVFKNRSLYYWAKVYSSQMKEGEQYTKLCPTICINILDFNLFANTDRPHLCFMLRDREDPDLFLTDHLAIHYLELPHLIDYRADNELEQWLYFLKHEGQTTEDEKMRTLLEENPNLRQAHEHYIAFTKDEELVTAYNSHIMWLSDHATRMAEAKQEGVREGMEQGIKQGIFENKTEVVQKMLDRGFDLAVISECTDMPVEAIRSLIEGLHSSVDTCGQRL